MDMATTKTLPKAKPFRAKRSKVIPRAGRKMEKAEARKYVFTAYGETMRLLAKH